MKPEHAPLVPLMAGTVDGTAFSVHGAGEPLVLVHGVGMGKEIWAPQIAAFSQDYQVIAYDMLGHGDSALPAADVTLRDYADQLAGLLEPPGNHCCQCGGHSMGALVALEFALAHPQGCCGWSR
jgi:pimeloyl-ACP methyl ester carboxylesterase